MTHSGDSQANKPGWYPDLRAGVLRYWDGKRWTDATQPIPSAATAVQPPKRGGSGKWIASAAVAVVVLMAAGAALFVHRASQGDDRWSELPQSMNCGVDPGNELLGAPMNPLATTASSVTLTHPGDQKLAVTLEFADSAPPNPMTATSPYSGEKMVAPGSYDIQISVGTDKGAVHVFPVPSLGGWGATRLDLAFGSVAEGGSVSTDFPSDILTSFEAKGNAIKFVLDLDGQPRLFDDGALTPDVRVNASKVGAATVDSPNGVNDSYASQLCAWGSGAESSAAPTTSAGAPAPSAVLTNPGAASTSTNARPASCGPSEADALSEALAQVPDDSVTGRSWSPVPVASNFDPCADLSTMLVMVEGGTGSSPVQALMFHRGEYVGTGTSKAYGFTDLDVSTSTPDTVVLTYKSGQTCNACNDGITTAVRFQWDGQSVQMLDAPPA